MKRKMLEKLSHMSLAKKISFLIANLLAVVFILFIVVSSLISGLSIEKSVRGEVSVLSEKNALKVQGIFDDASSVADIILTYVEKQYIKSLALSDIDKLPLYQGQVYDNKLSKMDYETEKFQKVQSLIIRPLLVLELCLNHMNLILKLKVIVFT
ncbi:hypothetical protein [Lachnoclostridium sp.]|uniref:hypothetical protein n=1 Tax=Lachnoclostridium sp. TaxID=2028282 RepID=UPI002899C6CE|nr:hypothetical protein [Lachnoclostridium sp.]